MVLTKTTNAGFSGMFRTIFKPRDIFLHDGKTLRRVKVGSGLQAAAAFVAGLLLFWSIFAAAQLVAAARTPAPSYADVARMERELAAMQADVAVIKEAAQRRYQFTASEVRRLGLDPSRLQARAAVGGPYEPVETVRAADPNFKALFNSWARLDQLEQSTVAIPSSEPVHGTNFTSGFGVRSDPFRGRAAMHAGIDLAGAIGTPIYLGQQAERGGRLPDRLRPRRRGSGGSGPCRASRWTSCPTAAAVGADLVGEDDAGIVAVPHPAELELEVDQADADRRRTCRT
jgi:hypothetical protein